MSPTLPQSPAKRTRISNHAVETIEQRTNLGKLNGLLRRVQEIMDVSPLSSGEYYRIRNLRRNAESYIRSEEWGAASYELRMLDGAVRSCCGL